MRLSWKERATPVERMRWVNAPGIRNSQNVDHLDPGMEMEEEYYWSIHDFGRAERLSQRNKTTLRWPLPAQYTTGIRWKMRIKPTWDGKKLVPYFYFGYKYPMQHHYGHPFRGGYVGVLQTPTRWKIGRNGGRFDFINPHFGHRGVAGIDY